MTRAAARRQSRRKPVPPGKRASSLPPCTYAADHPNTAPGPGQPPLCASCGLPESHGRHHQEVPAEVHDAQAEHRRRTGDWDEDE